MKEEIVKKIKETNQKYLGKLVDQEIPQKLEKQLKDMELANQILSIVSSLLSIVASILVIKEYMSKKD